MKPTELYPDQGDILIRLMLFRIQYCSSMKPILVNELANDLAVIKREVNLNPKHRNEINQAQRGMQGFFIIAHP